MNGPRFSRYVALGDSTTEGMCDGDDLSGYRGWADRLAEHVASAYPGLRYANLAVRGRRAAEVRAEQLAPALALRPDLVTVVAGMNDMIRPKFDAAAVASELEAMFAALSATGAKVATITFPDLGAIVPLARPIAPRAVALNELIMAAAKRHDVTVFDAFRYPITTDARLWSADRLHANPVGHERIAAAMAQTLGLPGSNASWSDPLPPLAKPAAMSFAATELRWLATFLGPWVGRRIRGKSSGDGRLAKRPELLPLDGLSGRWG